MKIVIVDDEQMSLNDSRDTVKEVYPQAEVICFDSALQALQLITEQKPEVAMLDIEMPEMSGLALAKRIKEVSPDTNIIFVTAYSQYALDAIQMYVSGYLLKPLQRADIEQAFEHLRHPVRRETFQLRIQCFGNFEVFYRNEPVQFPRAKSKEILAYLVELNGAAANTGELCGILWEDSIEQEKNKHYLRNLMGDLKKVMKNCEAEDSLVVKRNQFAVKPEKIDCDYYRFLQQDPVAVNQYRGEYMRQYSWAEFCRH